MEPIYLPDNVAVQEAEDNTATFVIEPYHPGYGPTLGNALRRVLLSSLPGSAITHVHIDGVEHEFSALDGVKEDLISVLLNLKRVRIQSDSEEPQEITLEASGKGKVTAKEFKTPPGVTVINEGAHIATLTDDKAKLTLRCTVERGRGYMPSETNEHEQRPIGTIALDAAFTPVERVSFTVDNVRVGQETNYHKLTLVVKTDGSVTPHDAVRQAASILMDHFKELTGDFAEKLTAERPEEIAEPTPEPIATEQENTLNQLQLPSRVHNALERIGITTVEQVLELSEEQIQDIPGLGDKAVEDIMKARDDVRKELDRDSE